MERKQNINSLSLFFCTASTCSFWPLSEFLKRHKTQQTALYSQDSSLWLFRTGTIVMIKAGFRAITSLFCFLGFFFAEFFSQNGFKNRKCLFISLRCNIWIQWKHLGREKVRNTVSLLCTEGIHNPIYDGTVEPGELGWASRTLAELKLLELRITSKLALTLSRSHTQVPDQGPVPLSLRIKHQNLMINWLPSHLDNALRPLEGLKVGDSYAVQTNHLSTRGTLSKLYCTYTLPQSWGDQLRR